MTNQSLFGKEDEILTTIKTERVSVAKEIERIENQILRLSDKRKEMVERRDNLDAAMDRIMEGAKNE